MRRIGLFGASLLAALLVGCASEPPADPAVSTQAVAPGAPGERPTWSNAQKTGIGTSYEAYDEAGQFSDSSPSTPISKVWFSLGQDRITEVMWGLIHEAQIREIQFLLVGPEGQLRPEGQAEVKPFAALSADPVPNAPVHTITTAYDGGATTLSFVTITDPSSQTLVTTLELNSPRDDLSVFAYIDPALGNSGSGDRAWREGGWYYAQEGEAVLAVGGVRALDGVGTVGFVGSTPPITALLDGTEYDTTGETPGNVDLLVEVPFAPGSSRFTTLFFGFGASPDAAKEAAELSQTRGAGEILTDYRAGWSDYLSSLEYLPQLAAVAGDDGALAYMSALNLKVMEDKTHAGALIASLSNPWGETAPADTPQTGYKAVWPRDFFQVASAFLAMGGEETARAAYRYLPNVQVTDATPGNSGVTGWFLQKTHVDGTLEWVAVQQDQTAMPIMLGWQLWQAGVISDQEMAESYQSMLKPAADFLVNGGRTGLLWNTEFEASLGYTQQERWEEQEGYSPSTIAAVIGGLVTAADLAENFGDPADAEIYLAAADELEANIENWMFTTDGPFGDGEYFIRVTRNKDPNDKARLGDNNGRPGLPEDHIVDGGFLELVRYGVRAADAPSIMTSAMVYQSQKRDDNLRNLYTFDDSDQLLFGFRRYGNDGYGEDGERGTNYHELEGGNTPGQRGRVWPFFSGEFAHFLLALGPRETLGGAPIEELVMGGVRSMEHFANEGLSLPEQVWDDVGPNPFGYERGEGTNTATPLAWTHAEYIKLLRSVADEAVWDRYDVVEARYKDSARNQPEE